MPISIPKMSGKFLKKMRAMSFQEIAFEVAKTLFKDDLPLRVLKNIIDDALDFKIPLVKLDEYLYVLELFHGPTMAFKDVAARFMARLMSYYQKKSGGILTILVATSGDTGSAVANGFWNMTGIKVVILYPSKKVSKIQEAQLATMGENVTALEIKGTFDDCQKLVKQALVDRDIKEKLQLASANSINIARLLPQSLYYFYAWAQLKDRETPTVISVPSGNFGNLTAGLIAKRMGLPIERFIAATNANDSFLRYLKSGRFRPSTTKATISNAMDVGNPSNFSRIKELYKNNVQAMREDISSYSFSDKQTKSSIQEVFNNYSYILDPHGAVGYLGLKSYFKENKPRSQGIFFETAHPAKFKNIVEDVLNVNIPMPRRLSACMNKKKKAIMLSNKFPDFKDFLLR